jgi:hypothetical protein
VVVADISFGDLFWSMLWFFFLFIWIMILIHILGDLFRDHTLSGGAKALWCIALVFLPFLTVLIYLIARGQGMTERSIAQAQKNEQQFAQYVQSVGGSGGATAEIARGKELLDSGAITQAEFDQLKAKALAG